jgi:hypothetical protein
MHPALSPSALLVPTNSHDGWPRDLARGICVLQAVFSIVLAFLWKDLLRTGHAISPSVGLIPVFSGITTWQNPAMHNCIRHLIPTPGLTNLGKDVARSKSPPKETT